MEEAGMQIRNVTNLLHFYKPTAAFCDFVKSVSLGDWMLVFNVFFGYTVDSGMMP